MATILGYLLGAVFAAGIYLSPVVLFVYEASFVFDALSHSTSEQARITKCHYKWQKRSSSSGSGSWAPVAVTDNEKEVIGHFRFRKKKWCEYFIGSEVEVFLSHDSSKKSQINTFLQLWFLPLIYGLLVVSLYTISIRNLYKRYRKKRA